MVPYRSVDQLYQNELQQTPEKIKEYQKNTYFAGQWKSEYDQLINVSAAWTRHPDYPKVAWNAALTSDMVFTQPVVYEFKLLKPETLLIIGTRDKTAIGKERVSDKEREKLGNYFLLGKRAAKEIPRAKLVELKDVGHMPQVEAFDAYFQALVNFL
jgi:pimeloyl-ACP methyl ester carboxylesterase